jgi:hypothetical protein
MRKGGDGSLDFVDTLEIDKDAHVDAELNKEYVCTIIDTCRKRHVKVLWIKTTITVHGRHFYVKIHPPLSAEQANRLQYLLGDDSRRFDFNRARVNSALNGWNKLFELPSARLLTLYRSR